MFRANLNNFILGKGRSKCKHLQLVKQHQWLLWIKNVNFKINCESFCALIHLSLVFFPFWREKSTLMYQNPIKDFPPPTLNKPSLNVPLVSSLVRHLMYDKLSLRGDKYIFPIIFFPLQTSKKLKYHGNEYDKSPRHWNLSVLFIPCTTEAQKAQILCIKTQNKPMRELRGGKRSDIVIWSRL